MCGFIAQLLGHRTVLDANSGKKQLHALVTSRGLGKERAALSLIACVTELSSRKLHNLQQAGIIRSSRQNNYFAKLFCRENGKYTEIQ